MIEKVSKHPFLMIFIASIVCYLSTGGSLATMNIPKCMVLFGSLWLALSMFITFHLELKDKRKLLTILSFIPVGVLFGYLTSLVSNAILFIIFCGMGMVIVAGLILLFCKKLNWENAAILMMFVGFWIRMGRTLTMGALGTDQHDVEYFHFDLSEINTNMYHDDYILWFLNYWKMPDFDVRLNGQFYHPPLHYFISAVMLKINSVINPSLAENYDCLQCLSVLYSSVFMVTTYKIFKLFDMKGRGLFISTMLISGFPGLIILSGSITNDMLSVMFGGLAIYTALLWYRRKEYKTIILTAIFIGCGMMSKLSISLIAFPVAFIFLVGFIKESKKFKTIKQFVCFALVVFPLGLWFPIRNYILYKVPLTFVHELSGSAPQTIVGKTIFDRLFNFNDDVSFIPYLVFNENTRDYNVFLALMKTALFDEMQHQDNSAYLLLGSLMLMLLSIIMLTSVAGLIYVIYKSFKNQENRFEYLTLVILFITEMISYVSFALNYPMVSSMNFRYVAPVIISICLFYGIIESKLSISGKTKPVAYAMDGLGILFTVLSVFFMATTWIV